MRADRRVAKVTAELDSDEYVLLCALAALANLVRTLEQGKPHDLAMRAGRTALNRVLTRSRLP